MDHVSFFICNAYGETIEASKILELQKNNRKINIIFFNKGFENDYANDSLLKSIVKNKKINIIFLNNYISKIFITFFYIFFSKKIYISDDIYEHYSKFISLSCNFFIKKKILFRHTASPYYSRNIYPLPRNFYRDFNSKVIIFNDHDYNFFKNCGYKNIKLIRSKKDIHEATIKKIDSNLKFKNYILILSYRIHEVFSLANKIAHYKDLFKILKKTKIKEVYIKPHPSEKKSEIVRVLKYINNGKINIHISLENIHILSRYSKITIGFGTGGALIPFFEGRKSIIYYKNISKYLKYHQVMNSYEPKKSGIKIFTNEKQLKNYFKILK